MYCIFLCTVIKDKKRTCKVFNLYNFVVMFYWLERRYAKLVVTKNFLFFILPIYIYILYIYWPRWNGDYCSKNKLFSPNYCCFLKINKKYYFLEIPCEKNKMSMSQTWIHEQLFFCFFVFQLSGQNYNPLGIFVICKHHFIWQFLWSGPIKSSSSLLMLQ